MQLCDVENKHMVVRDTFSYLNAEPRTVPGDCYCTRCQQPVPFWFNDGQPTPVVEAPP